MILDNLPENFMQIFCSQNIGEDRLEEYIGVISSYMSFLTEKLRHHHHAPVIRGRWSDGRSLQRFCSRLHCTPCHKYQFVCPGEKRNFLWIRHLMM